MSDIQQPVNYRVAQLTIFFKLLPPCFWEVRKLMFKKIQPLFRRNSYFKNPNISIAVIVLKRKMSVISSHCSECST